MADDKSFLLAHNIESSEMLNKLSLLPVHSFIKTSSSALTLWHTLHVQYQFSRKARSFMQQLVRTSFGEQSLSQQLVTAAPDGHLRPLPVKPSLSKREIKGIISFEVYIYRDVSLFLTRRWRQTSWFYVSSVEGPRSHNEMNWQRDLHFLRGHTEYAALEEIVPIGGQFQSKRASICQ